MNKFSPKEFDAFVDWCERDKGMSYRNLSYAEKLNVALEYLGKDRSEESIVSASEFLAEQMTYSLREAATRGAAVAIMVRNKAHHYDSHIRPRIRLEDVFKRLKYLDEGSAL